MRGRRTNRFSNQLRTIGAIIIMAVTSACDGSLVHVSTSTNVDLKCPPGQMGGGSGGDGTGISCGGTNREELPAGTLVSSISNIVPIGGTLNGTEVCSSATGAPPSYKCKSGIPGQTCGLVPGKKCRDTYRFSTTVCDCLCM